MGQIVYTQNFRHQPAALVAVSAFAPMVSLVVFPLFFFPDHGVGRQHRPLGLVMVVATTLERHAGQPRSRQADGRPDPRPARGARAGPGGQSRQVDLRGRHQPRAAHADERPAGHGLCPGPQQPQRGPAPPRAPDDQVGRQPDAGAQRRAGPVEDRGRQGRAGPRGHQPARPGPRGRRRLARRRRREGLVAEGRDRSLRARLDPGRPPAHPPGADEPDLQRAEVHQPGRGDDPVGDVRRAHWPTAPARSGCG